MGKGNKGGKRTIKIMARGGSRSRKKFEKQRGGGQDWGDVSFNTERKKKKTSAKEKRKVLCQIRQGGVSKSARGGETLGGDNLQKKGKSGRPNKKKGRRGL